MGRNLQSRHLLNFSTVFVFSDYSLRMCRRMLVGRVFGSVRVLDKCWLLPLASATLDGPRLVRILEYTVLLLTCCVVCAHLGQFCWNVQFRHFHVISDLSYSEVFCHLNKCLCYSYVSIISGINAFSYIMA